MADELDITYDKKAPTYSMPGQCTNCGHEYRVIIQRGHEKPSWSFPRECPHCGCRTVKC